MNDVRPLTETEVTDFVYAWFRCLDAHAPVEELLPLLADESLIMELPEVTAHGHNGFREWYARVTHLFFDERHEVTRVAVEISGETATARLLLRWNAKVWRSPANRSEALAFESAQTWTLGRSALTGEPTINRYSVDTFTAQPDSPSLPLSPWEVVGLYYRYANAGDWDRWLTIMADDIVVDNQMAGHSVGIDSQRNEVEVIKKGYSSFQMHPLSIVADGQNASVVWHCQASTTAGATIDAIGANWFTVTDGKITYLRTIHDTAPFKAFIDDQH